MPLPNFLTKIFSGGAKDLIGTIGDTIDQLTMSKEEKEQLRIKLIEATNSHLEKMTALAQAETDSYLKDVADARSTNVQIQNSDKASWLSKNVAYIIDLFVFIIWGAMTIYIIGKFLNIIKAQQGVDFSGILGIYSGITAIAMTVLNFHRGSSKGSEDKSKQIAKLTGN